MPWKVSEDNGKYCVHKLNEDGSLGESLQCYDDQAEAEKYVKAMYANVDQSFGERIWALFEGWGKAMGRSKPKPADEIWGVTFTELETDILAKSMIDGMAAGTFVSMSGREVTFDPIDLPEYVANTQAIIDSTKTEGGEVVGLPIDLDAHDHKGGAGWIVGVELDEARKVVRFAVNWTQAGIDLIKANVRRFFSPTTDPSNKRILGGSMTNWPATRDDASGRILLRPVELSQSIKEIDMEKTIKETILEVFAELGIKAPPKSDGKTEGEGSPPEPNMDELLGTPEALELLGREAQARAADLIASAQRQKHVVEFAAQVVGGTRERPYGLKVHSKDLVKLLLSLPEKQARAVEKILESALESAVSFAEFGSDTDGYAHRAQLDAQYKPLLREWLAAGNSLAEFFSANPEIGKMEDFNLAEFIPEKKEA